MNILKEYVVVMNAREEPCIISTSHYKLIDEGLKDRGVESLRIIATFNADEQLQEQKGLRWVKASERVPDFKVITLVHLRFSTDKTGFKLTGYYKDGRWYRQHGEDNVLDWAPNLEWLEETEPGQPVPAGEVLPRSIEEMIAKEPVTFFLANALKYLDENQRIALRDALIERTPKQEDK